MKQHIAIVIAALMITSMAFAISTTSVTATHEQTPEIDKTTVKGGTPMVLTITVTNAGPAAIENVRITVPTGFAGLAPTIMIFEDNIVTLDNGNENVILLPKGTLVELQSAAVKIVGGTSVIILKGTDIQLRPELDGDDVQANLAENLSAVVTDNTYNRDSGDVETTDWIITAPTLTENAKTTVDGTEVTVDNGTVRLLTDTQVVRKADNTIRFPSDTLVELVDDTSTETDYGLPADNVVALENELPTNITDIDGINRVDDNTGRIFRATSDALTDKVYRVVSGDNILIVTGEEVVFPAGTEVVLTADTEVTLFDNTQVIRAANENATMTTDTATAAENQPNNWMQHDDTPNVQSIEWKGSGENRIAPNGNLSFPFAVTTPGDGEYTIYVRTTDTVGHVTIKEVTLTIDATDPTVTIAASPLWAKDNTDVTITVTASESLSKLDNVMVAEKNAPENTQISMTPDADNKVWTGTYTTSDNVDRDGLAMVHVIGAQLEDLVGNEGGNTDNTFHVDKLKPPTPDVLSLILGMPSEKQTNNGTWLVEGYSQDNYIGDKVATENMTVKIRFGATVYTVTSGAGGYFYKSITLTEGTQELGIQYIDPASNVGTENAENITYDPTKPSVSITSPENGAYINDNTPTIKLTIADATMGIENHTPSIDENHGYTIELCYENGTTIKLDPKAYPTSDPFKSYTFENDYPTELPENWYKIHVLAGDNLQNENIYFRFCVDVTAPTVPTPSGAENPLSGSSVNVPHVQTSTTLALSGSEAEVGDKVSVYLNDAATAATTATVDSYGRWTASISLTAGTTTKVEVTLTDVAGNEGARLLYGYTMADGTAPTVTLTTLPETTDKASITISGTVTKDAWEDWSDITLTVQVGTGDVEVPCVGGSYNYSLALAEGPNTIVVQAIDVAGNPSDVAHATVERTVTPWGIYAVILVIIALILAAIAIFAGPKIWKR